jgi:hypothetical protein
MTNYANYLENFAKFWYHKIVQASMRLLSIHVHLYNPPHPKHVGSSINPPDTSISRGFEHSCLYTMSKLILTLSCYVEMDICPTLEQTPSGYQGGF